MTFKAAIIESERGWGSKVDEVREFDTKEERDTFVKEYNEKWNPPSNHIPDWYMIARATIDEV